MIFSHVLYQLSYLARGDESPSDSPGDGQPDRRTDAPRRAALTSHGTGRILVREGDLTVQTVRNRQPACGFCEGTGLWADQEGDPDPCPLCEGTGAVPAAAADEAPAMEVPLDRLLALLPRLTQPERQRLYEELHALYDCRIYRL